MKDNVQEIPLRLTSGWTLSSAEPIENTEEILGLDQTCPNCNRPFVGKSHFLDHPAVEDVTLVCSDCCLDLTDTYIPTPDEVLEAEWEDHCGGAFAKYGIDDALMDAEGNPLITSTRGLELYKRIGGFSETQTSAPRPIIRGLIAESSLTNIVGLDGSGKSIFGLHAANAIAHGKMFLGQQLKPRTVLYLDQENKPHNLQRLKEEFGWQEFSSKNPSSKFIHANMFSALLMDAPADELLLARDKWRPQFTEKKTNELLVDWAKLHNPRPVIFIDTLARFFQGGDENSVQDFGFFWRQVNRLVEIGCAVVVLHHAQKNDAKKYRGSGDFKAKVDFHFVMENKSSNLKGNLDKFTIERLKQRSPDLEFSKRETIRIVDGDFQFADSRSEHPPVLLGLLADNPAVNQTDFIAITKRHKISREKTLAFLEETSLVDKAKGPSHNQWIYSVKS